MKIAAILTVPLTALALASCGDTSNTDTPTQTENPEQTAPEAKSPVGGATASATSSASESSIAINNEKIEFSYSYPAEASAIAPLAAHLNSERRKTKAEFKAQAEEDFAEVAKQDGREWMPHSLNIEWRRVANLPSFLSLSRSWDTFTGGAHGMYGMDSLVWDKTAAKPLDPLEMFESPAAFDRAVQKPFCKKLDAERAKRRGEPYSQDGSDQFEQCISPAEQTVLVGSAGGKQFDRMTIYVGPYAAGPYVEGNYEINLPVTAAVLEAVKDQYGDSFAAAE